MLPTSARARNIALSKHLSGEEEEEDDVEEEENKQRKLPNWTNQRAQASEPEQTLLCN